MTGKGLAYAATALNVKAATVIVAPPPIMSNCPRIAQLLRSSTPKYEG